MTLVPPPSDVGSASDTFADTPATLTFPAEAIRRLPQWRRAAAPAGLRLRSIDEIPGSITVHALIRDVERTLERMQARVDDLRADAVSYAFPLNAATRDGDRPRAA